jgi:hypothetical protein
MTSSARPLPTESHSSQSARWPHQGRHILAHYDAESIVVYQAYRPEIGEYAIAHGHFGGAFSFGRMSWIKPNFLWMMYRSGWGTKEGQEVTLGLRLRRAFFDELLAAAVPSSWDRERYSTEKDWSRAVGGSEVRLQWDPDHHPLGNPLERRAIQLGLRGETLRRFAGNELLEVLDMRSFVNEQRHVLQARGANEIETPREDVYRPAQEDTCKQLRLSSIEEAS